MPHILAARIGESCTTEGTGSYTVAGNVTSYRPFSDVCSVGDYFYGFVEAVDADGIPTGDWEEGLYTYSAANTLDRTEVHASSNAGVAVDWAAGTKRVYMAMTARLARTLVTGALASNGASVETPPPSGARPGYNPSAYGDLIFAEEFNVSTLNTALWNKTIWYEPEPAVVNFDVNAGGNSLLRIWPALDAGGEYFNRTIDTDGKFYATYGYYEVRAKLCKGYGAWPAIWIFNHIGADRPEIDIMEAYCGGERAGNGGWSTSADEPNNYGATVHRTDGDMLYQIKMTDGGAFPAVNLNEDFHKYGLHWDATGLQFTFDDQPLGIRYESAHFTRQMYLMLDLWFGSASGDPNNPPGGTGFCPTGSTNSYEIDYFRVWELASGEGSSGGGGTLPGDAAENIGFYGDSTVYGYGSGVGGQVATTMPEQFASVFASSFVTNHGVNSADSKMMLEGSGVMAGIGGWQELMDASNEELVFIQVGINDAAAGRSSGDYKYYLQEMSIYAKSLGKQVIFVTPNPTSTMDMSEYAWWMTQVAAAQGDDLIDVYAYCNSYMTANSVSITTICPDGIHPSDAMYINIGNYIATEYQALLDA